MIKISPIILDHKIIPGYFASEDGKIWCSRKRKYDKGIVVGSYISKEKREMTLNSRSKTRAHLFANITIPYNLITEDYDYSSKQTKSKTYQRKFYVHQLIMSTFKPIDLFPPDKLKDYWNDLQEPVKRWIRETAVINHIDHDPKNNCTDNLEWVTPRENSIKSVKFKQDYSLSDTLSF